MLELNKSLIIKLLREKIPHLKLIYLFGSYAQGLQHNHSDIDLAVLSDFALDNVDRWQIAQTLAIALERDIDLVDLRTASTVLCQQIVTQGKRLWGNKQDDDIFTVKTISMYQHLQEERQAILNDLTAQPVKNQP